jgi:hypothetical protein
VSGMLGVDVEASAGAGGEQAQGPGKGSRSDPLDQRNVVLRKGPNRAGRHLPRARFPADGFDSDGGSQFPAGVSQLGRRGANRRLVIEVEWGGRPRDRCITCRQRESGHVGVQVEVPADQRHDDLQGGHGEGSPHRVVSAGLAIDAGGPLIGVGRGRGVPQEHIGPAGHAPGEQAAGLGVEGIRMGFGVAVADHALQVVASGEVGEVAAAVGLVGDEDPQPLADQHRPVRLGEVLVVLRQSHAKALLHRPPVHRERRPGRRPENSGHLIKAHRGDSPTPHGQAHRRTAAESCPAGEPGRADCPCLAGFAG